MHLEIQEGTFFLKQLDRDWLCQPFIRANLLVEMPTKCQTLCQTPGTYPTVPSIS